MALIYIVEDDTNIREIESFALRLMIKQKNKEKKYDKAYSNV